MRNLVYGVGVNDGTYPAKVDGKNVKEYALWSNMLKRCYSEKSKKISPTYIGCYVSSNFKQYSYFYEWCQDQIGFNTTDAALDKDLLVKGNRVYSETSSVFLPQRLNNLFLKSTSVRGELPIGVSKHGNKYQAGCNAHSKIVYLGRHITPESAFNAYKTFKEAHIKELAEHYKDVIDPRAYQALMNYEVHIDD